MDFYLSARTLNLLAGLACVFLLAAGFYIEHIVPLVPCSLCILQRGVFALLAVVLFSAAGHNPKQAGIQIYGVLTILIAGLGIFLASRQIWLQLQPVAPAQVCMPGFAYIVAHLPLTDALVAMLQGSDNCGVVKWRLWGLSIAHWSLMGFVGLGVLGIWQIAHNFRKVD